jgi:hypothetical protein
MQLEFTKQEQVVDMWTGLKWLRPVPCCALRYGVREHSDTTADQLMIICSRETMHTGVSE